MLKDPGPEVTIPDRAPDCLLCRHFKITWEPAFPRACRVFGIKCRNLPSAEVYITTGKHCFSFAAKEQGGENTAAPEGGR